MSIDLVSIIVELILLIAGIVLFFLISRAVTIGRKFVGQVYRSRAFWFAGVMIVALISVLSDLVSILFNLYPSSSLSALGILVFIAWVLVMFVYADRTILVTLEMDFHHRNTLHWRPIRTLAYVAMFANVFYLYAYIFVTKAPTCSSCPIVYLPGLPSWVPVILPGILVPEAILAFIVTFGYTISALIIGDRRTSDMTMKRHVRWLGLSFLIFLGFLVGFTLSLVGLITSLYVAFLLQSFIILVVVYTFYRALMSLTPIGRLEVKTK
jgi:hypothetical protein